MDLPSLRFHPRLLDELRHYDATKLSRDIGAGLTVAVVALPLAMAFAIASGLKPEAGLFTAIIAGFLISALGGSKVQIGGPAGAFIVIIYGILERYGLANLLLSTVFAGVLLFAMGALRLGSLIRYMPIPIVIGFTNGIAVLIALSQLKDFFGLKIERMPGEFFAQVRTLAAAAHTVHVPTLLLALACLLLVFLWPRVFAPRKDASAEALAKQRENLALRLLRSLPGTIIVLVLATAAVSLFKLPVDTIGTRFGGVPQSLPSFALPTFSWELVQHLLVPSLTIALLGAIESLLCARVADSVIGDRHDPNQELMAQGVANVVTPFFGGLPATGTIARTMTNVRSGAASPLAGIIHALVLLLIVLVAAPLASNIPLAALAAILLFVAWNMGEWHEFARLRHFAMTYRVLMVATFVLTVTVDLTVAVEVGLVLACLFFIYRISSLTGIEQLQPPGLPDGVHAYSMVGALFFGAVGKIEGLVEPGTMPARALVLDLHRLFNMDATGLDALEDVHRALAKFESRLILCGVNGQPRSIMERSGFLRRLGEENCVESMEQALARAASLA